MNPNPTIKKLDHMIKANLKNKLSIVTLDFSYLPTLEMVESITPSNIKNYDIDISYLPEI